MADWNHVKNLQNETARMLIDAKNESKKERAQKQRICLENIPALLIGISFQMYYHPFFKGNNEIESKQYVHDSLH